MRRYSCLIVAFFAVFNLRAGDGTPDSVFAIGDAKMSVFAKESYVLNGPMVVRFILKGKPYAKERTAALLFDGVGLPTLTGREGSVSSPVVYNGKEERVKVRPIPKPHVNSPGNMGKIPIGAEEVIDFEIDLASSHEIRTPGRYELHFLYIFGDIERVIKLSFMVERFITKSKTQATVRLDLPGTIGSEVRWPVKRTLFSAVIGKVEKAKEEPLWYVGIGDYRPAKETQISEAQKHVLAYLRGGSRYSYFPVLPDTAIEELQMDFKGQVWVHMKSGKKEALLVWNAVLRKHRYVVEWQEGAVGLTPLALSNKEYVAFFSKTGTGRQVSTLSAPIVFFDREIEAEVQKRVAAELKKRGIEPEKPDEKKDGEK